MILQNRNFSNHFGCTVVFTIVPLAPTIITSTAFLALAAFCARYQSVVTFISFYVFLFGICICTLTITISTSGILIVFWQWTGIGWIFLHPSNPSCYIGMQIHHNTIPNAFCWPNDKRLLCHVSVGSKSLQSNLYDTRLWHILLYGGLLLYAHRFPTGLCNHTSHR